MNNCNLTKFKGTVSNSSLLRLNEGKITALVTGACLSIDGEKRTLDGTFFYSDAACTNSLGTTTNQVKVYLKEGTVAAFKKKTYVGSYIEFTNLKLSLVDFQFFSGKNNVTYMQIEGLFKETLDYLNSFNSITRLKIENKQKSFNSQDFVPLSTILASPSFISLDTALEGNLEFLYNNENIKYLYTYSSLNGMGGIVGDISSICPNLNELRCSQALWSSPTGRATTSTAFSLFGINNTSVNLGDSLENYLTNIANCVFNGTKLTIRVKGTDGGNVSTLATALKTKMTQDSVLVVNGTSY